MKCISSFLLSLAITGVTAQSTVSVHQPIDIERAEPSAIPSLLHFGHGPMVVSPTENITPRYTPASDSKTTTVQETESTETDSTEVIDTSGFTKIITPTKSYPDSFIHNVKLPNISSDSGPGGVVHDDESKEPAVTGQGLVNATGSNAKYKVYKIIGHGHVDITSVQKSNITNSGNRTIKITGHGHINFTTHQNNNDTRFIKVKGHGHITFPSEQKSNNTLYGHGTLTITSPHHKNFTTDQKTHLIGLFKVYAHAEAELDTLLNAQDTRRHSNGTRIFRVERKIMTARISITEAKQNIVRYITQIRDGHGIGPAEKDSESTSSIRIISDSRNGASRIPLCDFENPKPFGEFTKWEAGVCRLFRH